jgi:hypothetical protein
MKVYLVMELDYPDGGTVREVQRTFAETDGVTYRGRSRVIALPNQIAIIDEVMK